MGANSTQAEALTLFLLAFVSISVGLAADINYLWVVVFMSVATTIVAPPLLKIAYKSLLEKGSAEMGEEVLRPG
jgi:Kef-type K+ transport system membrane component KefB